MRIHEPSRDSAGFLARGLPAGLSSQKLLLVATEKLMSVATFDLKLITLATSRDV